MMEFAECTRGEEDESDELEINYVDVVIRSYLELAG